MLNRSTNERLKDILAAAAAINAHLRRGDLNDSLILDAVQMRIMEIGEAVKAIKPWLLACEPDVSWRNFVTLYNHLAYRYFDDTLDLVEVAVKQDLPQLVGATQRLLNNPGRV